MTSALAAIAAALAVPLTAMAQAPAAGPATRIVLVAFTGVEDGARLAAPFHHAVLMRKSGVAEVAVVVYGRAVAAVVPAVKGVPARAREDLQEALRAGVKVYICAHSLDMAGLAGAPLAPGVEKVPAGAVKIAELVRDGYVPLQY